MKITQIITTVLFASSVAMYAQDKEPFKPYLAFGFAFAQGHAHDMTQKTWNGLGAYAAEFGLEFSLPQARSVKLRPNFGMARILSGDPVVLSGPTEERPADPTVYRTVYDLMGIYVGFDLVYNPFKSLPGISVTTGPSFHTWNVDEVTAVGNPNQGEKGMKFGWRLGVGYDINEKFRVTCDFALTEWRTFSIPGNANTFVEGFNPSRPAYFTLKASYSF